MSRLPLSSHNANFSRVFLEEIQKVSWPTRSETIRLTLVVVGLSLFVGVYVGVIDLGLARMLGFLTQ